MHYSRLSADRRTELDVGADFDLRTLGLGVNLLIGPVMYGIYCDIFFFRVWFEVFRYPDYTKEYA